MNRDGYGLEVPEELTETCLRMIEGPGGYRLDRSWTLPRIPTWRRLTWIVGRLRRMLASLLSGGKAKEGD